MKTIASASSTIRSKSITRGTGQRWRLGWNGLVVALIVAAVLFGGVASAQSSPDEAWYKRLFDNFGKAMYFCAWPSDTYNHVEFGRIEWKPGGADVSAFLYGTSWLEGRNWAEIVLEIRNGEVTRVRWGRYQGAWPPGTFFGSLLDELNKEMKRQQPQEFAVLCLSNPTPDPIVYSLPSESIASQTLAPGQLWMFWHPGSDDFTVSFGGLKNSSIQKTVRAKGVTQGSKPTSCGEKVTYDFVTAGQRVGLKPRAWIAGTEDPFTPNLVRSENEGKWICADGYKWAVPDDLTSNTCVPNSTGLIGVEIRKEDGALLPAIVSVRPTSPAGRAGLPPGSYLAQVDGESVQDLSIEDVAGRLRGPVNTVVRIGVIVPGRDQIQFFTLKRE